MSERSSDAKFDAILVLSFGGPEAREDVLPFLQNVLRGKNVPYERMLEVAGHYDHFEGKSPINEQTRELIACLRSELDSHGIELPIYWGNRNWHPLLVDEMRKMADHGVRRALAYVTSAFSSYSGCRQYLENIDAARAEIGSGAPRVEKLRAFYNHPGFIEAATSRVRDALSMLPASRVQQATLIFTAHSIPIAMADTCDYVLQLRETADLISRQAGHSRWRLAYQSRSGPPHQKWLEPDVSDVIRELRSNEGMTDVVVAPIGFLSDHLEVLYDLDIEVLALCQELGVNMVRAKTVGTHPRLIQTIRELVEERVVSTAPRLSMGRYGPHHDVCPSDCCRYRPRPPARP